MAVPYSQSQSQSHSQHRVRVPVPVPVKLTRNDYVLQFLENGRASLVILEARFIKKDSITNTNTNTNANNNNNKNNNTIPNEIKSKSELMNSLNELISCGSIQFDKSFGINGSYQITSAGIKKLKALNASSSKGRKDGYNGRERIGKKVQKKYSYSANSNAMNMNTHMHSNLRNTNTNTQTQGIQNKNKEDAKDLTPMPVAEDERKLDLELELESESQVDTMPNTITTTTVYATFQPENWPKNSNQHLHTSQYISSISSMPISTDLELVESEAEIGGLVLDDQLLVAGSGSGSVSTSASASASPSPSQSVASTASSLSLSSSSASGSASASAATSATSSPRSNLVSRTGTSQLQLQVPVALSSASFSNEEMTILRYLSRSKASATLLYASFVKNNSNNNNNKDNHSEKNKEIQLSEVELKNILSNLISRKAINFDKSYGLGGAYNITSSTSSFFKALDKKQNTNKSKSKNTNRNRNKNSYKTH